MIDQQRAMSLPNLSKPVWVRSAAALAAAAVALAWIRPHDTYTAIGALLMAGGTAGLIMFAERLQLWRLSIEVAAAIMCGWLCVNAEFPACVRDGNYVLDEMLPNWECGIIFGWLLAGIGTRLAEVDWSRLLPRQIQFSLMRLWGMTSLIAASLGAAVQIRGHIEEPTHCAIAGSISIVCAAAAAGLLIEQAVRFTRIAIVVVAALSATVMILANTLD